MSEKNARPDLPHPRARDLRGRQSVRATFRLSSQAIKAISIVAAQWGIKQKSLFDHLIDDLDTLSLIAQEVKSFEFKERQRVQKTFVLNRQTLHCLDQTSQRYEAPRDALVEVSIQRLYPIIMEEKQKQRQRKKMLAQTRQYLEEGQHLLHSMSRQLHEDDPMTREFETAMAALEALQANMEAIVHRGEAIEEFFK